MTSGGDGRSQTEAPLRGLREERYCWEIIAAFGNDDHDHVSTAITSGSENHMIACLDVCGMREGVDEEWREKRGEGSKMQTALRRLAD